MKKYILLFTVFILSCSSFCCALKVMPRGQSSTWLEHSDDWQYGIRYIPQLTILHSSDKIKNIDAEISLDMYATEDASDMEMYRSWIRYAPSQLELRLGLQKINFGPAKFLRSLMWFDQIDERDPLLLTNGVSGLLGRYYFLNNANLWIWGLYGNRSLKGLELLRTGKSRLETGGRLQMPVPRGEVAVSIHRRHISRSHWNSIMGTSIGKGTEIRYGFDGDWDAGAGLWCETALSNTKTDTAGSYWQGFLTLGTDYTFNIGPGVHALYEHFFRSAGSKMDNQKNAMSFSALSADLSISILDAINGILYYDWKTKKIYTYLGWQRTYDDWLLNVSIFDSPDRDGSIYNNNGIRCMVSYNY
ncbi:hypothetical protein ACFLUV_01615 [Elusimicrobiota bacterium]